MTKRQRRSIRVLSKDVPAIAEQPTEQLATLPPPVEQPAERPVEPTSTQTANDIAELLRPKAHVWLPPCAAEYVQGTADDLEFEAEPLASPALARPSSARLFEQISDPHRGLLRDTQ